LGSLAHCILKWIVGYSDITVFHAHLPARLGMEFPACHHATEFSGTESIRKPGKPAESLDRELKEYVVDANPSNTQGNWLQDNWLGGNLSVIYSILGSPSDL
jgi:muramoyltetrapeptide carboxypeptidase